jgi:hypothetical protein
VPGVLTGVTTEVIDPRLLADFQQAHGASLTCRTNWRQHGAASSVVHGKAATETMDAEFRWDCCS